MHRNGILDKSICSIIAVLLATLSDATAANVVQRTSANANRVSVSRPTQAASRMPTMTVKTGSSSTSVSTTPTTTETTTQPETQTEPVVETPAVENKSTQFGSTLASKSTTETDTAAATLAELVRAQRAALDAAGALAVVSTSAHDISGTGENNCDTALRECMIQKCGSNFSKCIADTDTTFFDKMDTCRRSTKCRGHEYQLFSAEIKADRDFNAKLAAYNATIDCGTSYDTCIVGQCGATYSKCIGKSAGDTAIAKCESIAKSCMEYDSGLAMRAMGVFGELRQTAERQIAVDEQKLYTLREQMRSVCTRLGAMFDERSLDCVYTVNFRAGDDNTLFASKKLYAGSVFDCTQNWFGIDVTTFRENAFRETRAQTAASSAMLGSGLGQAVGALTSGAIDRAVDRFRADNALKDALDECMETYTESECRAKIGDTSKKSGNKDSAGGSLGSDPLKQATDTLNNGTGQGSQQPVSKASTDGNTSGQTGDSGVSQTDGTSNQGTHASVAKAYDPATGAFSVRVLDAETGQPIAHVDVMCEVFDVNCQETNTDGKYTASSIPSNMKEYPFYKYNYKEPEYKSIKDIPAVVYLEKLYAYNLDGPNTLAGAVMSESGIGEIEGVQVEIVGTDKKTTTSNQGTYKLRDVSADNTVRFTKEGYQPLEFRASEVLFFTTLERIKTNN